MKINNKQALFGAIAFFGYLGLNMFGSVILYLLTGIDISQQGTESILIYSTSIGILTFAGLCYLFKEDLKRSWADFRTHHQTYFTKYGKIWFGALILMIACNIAISSITGNDTSGNQETLNRIFDINPFYIFVSAVLIAPFVEEMVFRLGFRKLFTNDIFFIIISGLTFSLMHVVNDLDNFFNLIYIIPYSIPGFAFAYILVKSKNILVSILFHFIHNGLSVSLMFLAMFLG